MHWRDWCWRWSSNTLATLCEELTHWKRPWCWEKLKAGEKGDKRGWDGWMSSLSQRIWVWASSSSWWWTGKPEVLQSMGSQRTGHDWVTEMNWNSANFLCHKHFPHKQVSDNNPSHALKLKPTCSSWDILCKNPWTNVNGSFIYYFLGTTAEGFVLSHASLKNNKHLNILPSQLNQRKERASQNQKT